MILVHFNGAPGKNMFELQRERPTQAAAEAKGSPPADRSAHSPPGSWSAERCRAPDCSGNGRHEGTTRSRMTSPRALLFVVGSPRMTQPTLPGSPGRPSCTCTAEGSLVG
jgi:hypothetical protein